jgi:ribulose-bisphosphate carboxylase small chain
MRSDERNAERTPAQRAPGQIGQCLRRGCVICIEHTPTIAPRFTPWELWGRPCCYDGNEQGIYTEIDRCRTVHADHHIRLNIEDYSCSSRFSLVVHSPSATG